MGVDLIIAMVLAAGVTHGIERGKQRSRQAWEQAKARAEERGAARERARQERIRAWENQFAKARAQGPTHPLWWAHATGLVLGGATAALAAGATGFATGAVAGARSGYRAGREGSRRAWGYRQTWIEWRSRDWIDTVQCQRCGGYAPTVEMVRTAEHGRVCPDCVPRPAPGRDEPAASSDSETDPREKAGPCRSCGRHCPRLERDMDGWCTGCVDALLEAQNNRVTWVCEECGHVVGRFSDGVLKPHGRFMCVSCSFEKEGPSQEWRAAGGRSSTYPGSSTVEDEQPDRIYVDSERADGQEDDTKENATMSELMPANGAIAATGEGYTDTIQSLQKLAKFLQQAHEEVTTLGDMLTSNSLDADTISQINDLADLLETAAPGAERLAKHVEERHAPLADAVAGAGGSANVATKSWYDQY